MSINQLSSAAGPVPHASVAGPRACGFSRLAWSCLACVFVTPHIGAAPPVSASASPVSASASPVSLSASPISVSASPITTVAVSPDGKWVLAGSQRGLEVRHWSGLKLARRHRSKLRHIHRIRFDASGKRVILAGGTPAESGGVERYSWPDLKLLGRTVSHSDVVYDVAEHQGALLTGSHDRRCRLRGAGIDLTMEGHSRGVTAVAGLSGHGVLTAGLDRSIRFWRIGDKPQLVRTLNNHTKPVNGLAVCPRREGLPMIVSVSQDRTIRFWQPTIGRMVRFHRLADAVPLAVCWLDEKRVAVCCSDGALRVVDSETAAIVYQCPALTGWAYCLASRGDGKSVVVGGEGGRLRVLATAK